MKKSARITAIPVITANTLAAGINFGGGRINATNNACDINYFITDHLGSTRVIVDANGTVKAQYNYYPFGKQWEDVNLMANTNRYTFSGKEKQTVRDLGWLDFMARMYSNSEIPIFTTQDPLSEKYYSLSPYMYCAGNPLRYVDPTGMKITGDTAAVQQLEKQANKQIQKEQKRQMKLNKQIAKRMAKGKNTDKLDAQLTKSQYRQSLLNQTISEIDELRASNNIYNVNTSYVSPDSDGSTEYGGVDANGNYIININVSSSYNSNGGLAHELVHGYQFETGQIDFHSDKIQRGALYDIFDEVSAFTRQFAFTNNPLFFGGATASYVRRLTNQRGEYIYKTLPNGILNVNSTYGQIMLARTGAFNASKTSYKMLSNGYIYNNR
jgi:RHS repeat-associated protein